VVYQGDSFLMYATLADGTEMAVRGVVRSATIAALPPVGGTVTLGLHPEDTALIADQEH
jgi:putative spermidine/putrescine transport system ATP-binding protein